jgi:hypothetical protein
MASINAINVAKEVISRIEKGEKVVMGEILENIGYSENTRDNPKLVTETKSYKKIMDTFVNRLEKEISRIQTAMEAKDLDKEQYRVLTDSLDKLYKNKQLATGGDTERGKIMILPTEVIQKYGIKTDSSPETNS